MPKNHAEIIKHRLHNNFPYKRVRGCSYENNFLVVFLLNREKDIISSRSCTKYFPTWARFILAACQMGKLSEKPLIKMGDINLKKNGSVFLYLNISRLDSHFMFDGSSTTISYSKTTQNFYVFFTKTKTKNNCLKFLVNRTITELLLQCIE